MTNAFLAALLKVAAEERLKANSLRNIMAPEAIGPLNRALNAELEKDAMEHDGRAEVYESFARDLTPFPLMFSMEGEAELLREERFVAWMAPYSMPVPPLRLDLLTGI